MIPVSGDLGGWLLSLTWLLPLGAALALMAFPSGNRVAVRRFSLGVAGLNLGLVAWLAVSFAAHPPAAAPGSVESALAFALDRPWLPFLHAHYIVGVDAISLCMMFLAAVIVFCGTLASWDMGDRTKEFFILLQALAAGTFGSFITFDLLAFFVFNELTLIPTYLLIGMFGSGPRAYAAMKLNLMLMGGSALILLGILGVYFESGLGSFDLLQLAHVRFDRDFQLWAFPVLFTGFAILGNLFPFHIWSPDGHASAPTAISMFLAGVHMKLGSYGCLRIAMYLLPEGAHAWMDAFLALAAIGIVWGAVVAAKQKDLKYMNAYSSVSHCAMVFLGFAVLNAAGLRGAVMQMLAHGFITAAVFCLIGMVYARTHTRLIPEMGGLMRTMPFLGASFVIAGFAALGLPGLAGFAAELNVFLGALAPDRPWTRFCGAAAVLSIIVTAVYILRAANSVFHGPARSPHGDNPGGDAAPGSLGGGAAGTADATMLEKIPVVLLIACIIAMGVYPGRIAALIDGALAPILNNLNR
jgi:NADH-quinone oxidoreductase subunit M